MKYEVVTQLRGVHPPRDLTFDGEVLMCRLPACANAREIFKDALALQPEFILTSRVRVARVCGGTMLRLSVRARHDPSRKLQPQ